MTILPRLGAATVALGVALALAMAPAASAHQHGSHDHGKHQQHRHHHGHHHHGQHGHHHGHKHGHKHGHGHGHGHGHPKPNTAHVLASGLISPLRAAVAPDGTTYVSQNFTGTIVKISPKGAKTPVYADPNGYEVGGLSLAGQSLLFTVTQTTGGGGPEGENVNSWLKMLSPSGQVTTIADLHAYEVLANPDQGTAYGFAGLDTTDPAVAACLAKWPAANGPASYMGGVDSHPYATFPAGSAGTYVADAGANAVFLVSPTGAVSTVATLPAIPYMITAGAAAGMGLDPCFVGKSFSFEAVPTDIEVGRDGTIYVTSLPGGPEGPELGARGSVFAISPLGSHQVRQVATGLLGPTGLAVSPDGTLYVAQMFGNTVSQVTLGKSGAQTSTVFTTPGPAEVEWTPQGLYVTSNALAETGGDLIRWGR